MRKELGKWFLDIAKYMTTAILLSSVFSNLQNFWIYLSVILSILLALFIGLWLININDKKEKEN